MKRRPAYASGIAYFILTLAMTWPLLPGLTRDVPGDLGDSLLNMWILGWGAENVPRLLAGQISLAEFWNANIFHPEPLALSFSEHLFGQVLQILPVYHLTGNLILAYNLLFVSTFVLSGLGMFLLVRELLDGGGDDGGARRGFSTSSQAAFIAGLIYAFVPFRIAQVAHIQSLSSQWMPLALYGFVRFIRTDKRRALAGGSAALLMQNWSCGYYLIYFAPIAPLFVIHQVASAGRAREWRVWASFTVAALAVAAGTWPFLTLYLDAQRVHGFERSIAEVIRFSADTYSYATAPEALRLWGSVMQAYPKPEGELFFGLLPVVLAATAVIAHRRTPAGPARRSSTHEADAAASADSPASRSSQPRPGVAVRLLWVLVIVQAAVLFAMIVTGGFITSLAGIPIRATNLARAATGLGMTFAILLAASADARSRARTALRSPLTLAIVLMVLAVWLSLGPAPHARGRALGELGLYGVLYEHVPGFDGLRVPARYAMIAALFLSIAAGYGAATVLGRVPRPPLAAAAMAVVFILEAAFVPMPINLAWGDGGLLPPPRVEPADSAPAIYRHLATLDDARVVAEFPFGDPAWELRYVYYSTVHWKRLVNGYSGAFPQRYKVRVARFQRVGENPDEAWQALRETGATHVIVHESAMPAADADTVTRWLKARGAREIARFADDVLFAIEP